MKGVVMEKNILILCCGFPFETDKGFGYFVFKSLEKIKFPDNVDLLEVGESACMIPSFIEGKDLLIVIDFFKTGAEPGTIVRLTRKEEVPLIVNAITDVPKLHFMENLEMIEVSGKLPEMVFLGVVPKDTETSIARPKLTPEVKKQVPKVVKMVKKIVEEFNAG
jgi:hydrogenase maturation protease